MQPLHQGCGTLNMSCGALLCVRACVCAAAVGQAFEELVLKILETPALVSAALGSGGVKLNQQAQQQASTCSC
jgi:hypothetical protein